MSHKYDVIVLGAGLSGLVAAHTILEKESSLELLILEARERIGGRILSAPLKVKNNKTCLFDVGAHWYSSSQTQLMKYINLLQLTPVLQQTQGKAIGNITKKSFQSFKNHPIIGNVFTVYELKWFFALLENKSKLFKFYELENNFQVDLYDSITMDTYINSKLYTKSAKMVMRNIVQSTTGVDPTQISVLFYLLLCNSSFGFTNQYMTEDGGGREFWIQEGAEEMCKRLQMLIGEQIIKLEEPVIEIDTSNSQQVKLITNTGKIFVCTNLISAIPPEEILKIKFDPPLHRIKKFVLKQTHTGHLIKFVITYTNAFWIAKGYSGQIFSCDGGPISICYDATKNDNPALTGYIKEPANGSYKDSVIAQLVKYWGEEASQPIDYFQNSWSEEEYIGGCPMTCPGIENIKWYHNWTKPAGRIHWAGAETATEWSGHMNGAVQAGFRAAINTLYDMRPQSLTYQDHVYINTRRTHRIRFTNPSIINKYTIASVFLVSFLLYRYVIKRVISK